VSKDSTFDTLKLDGETAEKPAAGVNAACIPWDNFLLQLHVSFMEADLPLQCWSANNALRR
jgi:hypothetical protein